METPIRSATAWTGRPFTTAAGASSSHSPIDEPQGAARAAVLGQARGPEAEAAGELLERRRHRVPEPQFAHRPVPGDGDGDRSVRDPRDLPARGRGAADPPVHGEPELRAARPAEERGPAERD